MKRPRHELCNSGGVGREGVGQPCCSVRRAGNIARREHGIRDTVPPIFAGGHSNALTNPSGLYQLNLTTSRYLKLQQISNTNIMTSKLEIFKTCLLIATKTTLPPSVMLDLPSKSSILNFDPYFCVNF